MRTVVVFLFVGFVISIVSGYVHSAEDNQKARIVRDTEMREEPDHSSSSISPLSAGSEVYALERRRLWVRIAEDKSEQTTGWVRLNFLRSTSVASIPTSKVSNNESSSNPFAGFSRSVSGFLGGFRSRNNRQAAQTSTIGIRGLTSEELTAANPDQKSLNAVSQFASSKQDAEMFANAGGLSARTVSLSE